MRRRYAMSDFTFKRGTFIKLRANSVIHLGRLERNIYEGDVVEFDGVSLKYNESTTEMPELKAGIKRGWLTIVEDDAQAQPKAPVQTPAKEMPVQRVYDEERSVAEVKPSEAEEAPTKFPLVVESQDDDMIAVSKVADTSGAQISSASSASDGIAESQGASEVGSIKIKTASKQKTVLSDGAQVSAEIAKIENIEASVTKKPAPTPEAVVVQDEVEIIESPETTEEEAPETTEEEAPETTEEEAPTVDQALENAQILQAIDGEVQPSQGAVVVGADESKIKVLPGGIEWDTSKHWSKRAKIAMDMYGNDRETLEAIMAVETKGVADAIKKSIEG
jgi:hypothetical protein